MACLLEYLKHSHSSQALGLYHIIEPSKAQHILKAATQGRVSQGAQPVLTWTARASHRAFVQILPSAQCSCSALTSFLA